MRRWLGGVGVQFSMIFHSYASPYDSWALNQYQTICLLCIFFLVFGGLICSGDISEDLRDKFDAVLIAFTSIPFCLLAIVSMDYVMALLQVSELLGVRFVELGRHP
jgi:hypothetical protein